jgi:hypothetical protein
MATKESRLKARWKPAGSITIKPKGIDAVIYVGNREGGGLYAVGYIGTAARPSFNYRFKTAEARDKYLAEWSANLAANMEHKAKRATERKEKLAKPCGLKVGDVLYGSWGYDQTNVEFWEVTKMIGPRMVEIRELCTETEATGYLCGKAVPLPGKYTDKAPLRKKVDADDGVKLFDWGCWLHKAQPVSIEGKPAGFKPVYWSAYA